MAVDTNHSYALATEDEDYEPGNTFDEELDADKEEQDLIDDTEEEYP